ncbi:MAG: hypothetical protein J1F35_00220 [Erysipelotrichales bacterium]|nr:hypothetical protein [Erysipelotrichales bacterium]
MKEKLIVILFAIYIFAFSILGIVLPKDIYSYNERRKLKEFPSLTLDNTYVNKLDAYLLDHFPYRDFFRSIKANFNYKVLAQLDNNKIVIKDEYIFKLNYPTNQKSIENYKKNIKKLLENFTENNKVYMVIIPDKNYYLKDDNLLKLDYNYLEKELTKLDINYIDIKNLLNLEDFYKTDTHWRQERLMKIVQELNKQMNIPYEEQDFKENVYSSFYGVYYGESAINKKPDTLIYLNNSLLDSLKVTYLENPKLTTIYNLDKLKSKDSYEVFLDGASSFIEIINENSLTEKELVVFRDSFGSSIAPLLTPYYKKITLIDNRYIDSNHFLEKIIFKDQDILFLNSTLLINESYTLKG